MIPQQQYAIHARNKPDGEWLQIVVPAASPALRWVNLSCGQSDFSPPLKEKVTNQQCKAKGQYDSYLLAISWQHGFCEHATGHAAKPECTAIHRQQLAIYNLTLHGLWPTRQSCGIRYGYCDPDKAMELKPETIDAIAPWIPNFYYQTDFGAYQWKKHGSCQHREDDDYFLLATSLVRQVDASLIGRYIKQHAGQQMPIEPFKQVLTDSFGSHAVNRIQLSCIKKRYLQEIRLSLGKDFEQQDSLSSILSSGPALPSFAGNCGPTVVIEN
ncbi:ribonuclease [Photobacterium sp. DA100]|uniref:ribonuclease T2 family protein n=1 Tax=Photobacterium sp. DA100 TaxID=3027472 RepID=UPI002478DC89|nr:ribonuclease [Photobacterium sp. DA100]WEM40979.1 ribonuclease [Photobacterium sp. DA100]